MKIQEIRVEGLLGLFDHTITLNDEGLTIIYGMNGIGKTMIMRMVEYLFDADFVGLSEIPFDRFEVDLTDKVSFRFEKTLKGIMFSYNNKEEVIEAKLSYDIKDLGQKLEKHYKELNIEFWGRDKKDFYKVNDETISEEKFLEKYPEYLPKDMKVYSNWSVFNLPKNMSSSLFQEEVEKEIKKLKTYFIKTQRLLSLQKVDLDLDEKTVEDRVQMLEEQITKYRTGRSAFHAFQRDVLEKKRNNVKSSVLFEVNEFVQVYAKELAYLITSKHEEYQNLSEKQELSLGKRLLNKEVNTDYTTEALKKELATVEKRLEELRQVGLLTNQKIEPITIDDTIDDLTKAVIAVNVQDIKSKLVIFDELYEKLSLFLDIINHRRFAYKRLIVSEEKGFTFENIKGVQLTSDELSSGEKHELILLYQLLFVVPKHTLIMIDEPELSLHISWQKDFVKDMLEIIRLKNIHILAATHSPSIINGNWDLTVSLKGLEEENYA